MDAHEWVTFAGVLIAVLAIVATIFSVLWKRMNSLKDNDLHGIKDRLDRIEKKLDKHLQWHLEEMKK